MNRRRQRSSPAILGQLLLLAAIAGCTGTGSKYLFVGCQVADVASTEHCLSVNPNCHESNPIGSDSGVGRGILYLLKLALSAWVVDSDDWNKAPAPLQWGAAAVGCWPVPGNLRTARTNRP